MFVFAALKGAVFVRILLDLMKESFGVLRYQSVSLLKLTSIQKLIETRRAIEVQIFAVSRANNTHDTGVIHYICDVLYIST
jgi:hypothetical protein